MKSQLVFDMPEERFERIRCPWQSRVVNVLKQIGNCPPEVYVCLPEVIADEIRLTGVGNHALFTGVLRIVLGPSAIHAQPPQLVVRASHIAESHYKIPEQSGFRVNRTKRVIKSVSKAPIGQNG